MTGWPQEDMCVLSLLLRSVITVMMLTCGHWTLEQGDTGVHWTLDAVTTRSRLATPLQWWQVNILQKLWCFCLQWSTSWGAKNSSNYKNLCILLFFKSCKISLCYVANTEGTNLVLGPPEKFYCRNPSGTFRNVHWYHLGNPKKVQGAPSQGFFDFFRFW